MKHTVILFDINETVLNLSALWPKFESAFGSQSFTDTWFAMLLHSSTVSMITGVKTDFATLSKIALETLAAKQGVPLSAETSADILGGFANLPAHADIKPALAKLRSAGFQTVAFSNSSLGLVSKQISNAGLNDYFDEVISVEEAETFKPNPQAYNYVAEKLGRDVTQLRLVATHDWDTHGAMSAGLKAAYINRAGALYNPLYKQTDISEATMMDVAEQIIATDL
ncbi:haloacid dehalogenase type II [Reinekea marinisedimentorum]|uniref:(S)-2-haloacid dehalogenase n=1 Tax=Reinekea marinisedimentorum TaxID=230495 RepID=A0A4R3I574_9GAMM|nr:haloacid dehalogenase type II [Reinekea marinisedimentorum]TCS40994.1 2-haloacid dehalogenase [Reinekea marinisedimentorum]